RPLDELLGLALDEQEALAVALDHAHDRQIALGLRRRGAVRHLVAARTDRLAGLDAGELQHLSGFDTMRCENRFELARELEGQEATLIAVLVMLIAGEAPAQGLADRAHGEAGLLAQFLQPPCGFRNLCHLATPALRPGPDWNPAPHNTLSIGGV